MSGGGNLSVGPPMSKFSNELRGPLSFMIHNQTGSLRTAESEHPSNDRLGREAPQMYLAQS